MSYQLPAHPDNRLGNYPRSEMKQPNIASRDKLKVIAQRAMIQRGLLPNF